MVPLHVIKTCGFLSCVCFLLIWCPVYGQSQPQTGDVFLDSVEDVQGKRFFESITKGTDDSWLMRELTGLVITSPRSSELLNDSVQVVERVYYFKRYEGQKIRSLRFLRLDPFGATTADTVPGPLTWIERTGNSVRTKTTERKVRNYTLFREGEAVDAFKMADTEQLLRGLDYIEDARIYITPVAGVAGYVDVVVVTHDVWPIALEVDIPHLNTGELEAWHRNFMGIGLDVEQGFYWGPTKHKSYGYMGEVGMGNLFQSLTDFRVNYTNKFERTLFHVSLERPFSIPTMKYGGRLSYTKSKVEVEDYYEGIQLGVKDGQFVTLRFDQTDVWLARSFRLQSRVSAPLNRRNLTLSGRFLRTHFSERPEDLEQDYYPLQNTAVYLGALTYTRQRSHLTRLVYSYGRNEDVPTGYLAELVLGHEEYEKADRFYAGARLAGGHLDGKLGYVYGDISYGLFFHGSATQGTWRFSWNYFTPLFSAGRYRSRTFFSGNYIYGFRSSTNEYVTLNGRQGIAGFRNDSIRGTQRLLLHWETNLFMPKKIYGFRFVTYAGGNFGWINSDRNKFILSEKVYSSLSIGFRVRNEHLVFSTFQFSFSWFPCMPKGSRIDWFDFSRADRLRLPAFAPQPPEVYYLK